MVFEKMTDYKKLLNLPDAPLIMIFFAFPLRLRAFAVNGFNGFSRK
jgi:hypothetical protein